MFFWNSLAFSMIQRMLAIWSLVPLPFLKPAWTLEERMATHCSIYAWRIPWTEEPDRLQFVGSQSQTRLSDSDFHFHHISFMPLVVNVSVNMESLNSDRLPPSLKSLVKSPWWKCGGFQQESWACSVGMECWTVDSSLAQTNLAQAFATCSWFE